MYHLGAVEVRLSSIRSKAPSLSRRCRRLQARQHQANQFVIIARQSNLHMLANGDFDMVADLK